MPARASSGCQRALCPRAVRCSGQGVHVYLRRSEAAGRSGCDRRQTRQGRPRLQRHGTGAVPHDGGNGGGWRPAGVRTRDVALPGAQGLDTERVRAAEWLHLRPQWPVGAARKRGPAGQRAGPRSDARDCASRLPLLPELPEEGSRLHNHRIGGRRIQRRVRRRGIRHRRDDADDPGEHGRGLQPRTGSRRGSAGARANARRKVRCDANGRKLPSAAEHVGSGARESLLQRPSQACRTHRGRHKTGRRRRACTGGDDFGKGTAIRCRRRAPGARFRAAGDRRAPLSLRCRLRPSARRHEPRVDRDALPAGRSLSSARPAHSASLGA